MYGASSEKQPFDRADYVRRLAVGAERRPQEGDHDGVAQGNGFGLDEHVSQVLDRAYHQYFRRHCCPRWKGLVPRGGTMIVASLGRYPALGSTAISGH